MQARDSSRPGSIRQRVWDLLEVTQDSEGAVSWDWVDVLLLTLILLNVVVVILETVSAFELRYHGILVAFDIFSVAIFSVEYVVRLWACTVDPRYREPLKGRIRYAASFYGVIDLATVLPFYIALALPVGLLDLRFLRILRLMRFARILKIGRYSEAMDRVKAVFRSKRGDLGVAFGGVLVVLVIASSLMYHVENGAQPDVFSSIPATMWWGMSTLTTVGYGDMAPVTVLGKTLGGAIQLLGIALFALPAGIIASGYEEEARRRREADGVCHTCGHPLA